MVTVIIPTLNEQETIANVVLYAKQQRNVSEVIVVDDKSLDNTVSIARKHGATVITSDKLGKGASMMDGVRFATNNIIVFLDGDIDPYPAKTIHLLTQPILKNKADFVKSTFNRNAGRVTELVAKPLLSIFFKDLLKFEQPLSGMIAGKKEVFEKVDFKDDYGVDVGLLIDVYLMNLRIREIEIGYIENKSKPWQELGKMSKEVAQTIIQKAAASKSPNYNFEEIGILKEIKSQIDCALLKPLESIDKMVIFDMDNTLLKQKFIDACAKEFGFEKELQNIRANEQNPVILTKQVATLLKGKNVQELLNILKKIPLVENTEKIIAKLKERKYVVGIISDSYNFITSYLQERLGMHFSLSNELEFSKNICTGEVKIPSFFFNSGESICHHILCKTNAMLSIAKKYMIKKENIITIGDSINDLCMIRESGVGISFCSNDKLLNYHADIIINRPSFSQILTIAK